jgi:hypothetical protein
MAAWLDERRGEARAALESTPLPTLKDENWRYTSLRGIDFDAFATVSDADADADAELTRTTVLGCIAIGWHVSAQPLARVSLCIGGNVGRLYATSAR